MMGKAFPHHSMLKYKYPGPSHLIKCSENFTNR